MKINNKFDIMLFLLCILFTNSINSRAQSHEKFDGSKKKINYELFDRLIKELSQEWSIPGISVAVIQNGKLEYYNGFGIKNNETGEEVDENTIFDAASLTKPLFAYFTMLMVDKGMIELDKPLITYMSKEDIDNYFNIYGYSVNQKGFKKDWFYKITPRDILSHSAGLPHVEIHWGTKPDVYPIFFIPGSQFKYSAEGYLILQKVFEKMMGHRLDILMYEYIFKPLKMTNSYMVWDEKIAENAAFGHNSINTPVASLRKAKTPHAGGSLYTTAKDYAVFMAAVLNGKFLSEKSQQEMFKPAINIEDNISYAPGFSLEESFNKTYIWHMGDYITFRNFAFADIEKKLGVVYLANSFYGLAIYERVVELLFEGEHPLLRCEFLKYYRSLGINRRILKNIDEAFLYFSSNSFREGPYVKWLEGRVNSMAYEFMNANRFPEAIKLFKYNTLNFPESANAWDSLGEMYMKDGQYGSALISYKKSLQLNPNNTNAQEMLKKLNEVNN